MTTVLDYSFARPAPAAIARVAVGVMRYLSGDWRRNAKDLSPGERDALFAAGLDVGLVWETTATRMDGGYSAGLVDAHAANAEADALSFPPDRPIYFANDQNRADDEHVAYMRGARDNSRRPVGPYGSTDLVNRCARELSCRYGWKVSSWGPPTVNATLVQEANTRPPIPGTDVNTPTRADWGQWHGGAPPPPPKPKEELMRPFFIAGSDSTVWFCREGVRSRIGAMASVQPLAVLTNASNGADGKVWNGDHGNDAAADDIVAQFAVVA